jgi:hypothetical protein
MTIVSARRAVSGGSGTAGGLRASRRRNSPRSLLVSAIALIGTVVLVTGCSSGSGSSGSGKSSAAGGGAASSSSPQVANVLLISALSGPYAPNAVAAVDGFKAAIYYVNQHGGFNGAKVNLVTKNDNGDPTVALSVLKSALSSGPKPMWVYAGWTSDEALAMMPTLTSDKLFSFETTAAAALGNGSAYPYQFNFGESGTANSLPYVQYLKGQGYTNVGLLTGNDAYGTTVEQAYEDAFKQEGVKFVSAPYSATATDLTPQLEKLKSSNVDVVLLNSEGPTAAYALKSITSIGWSVPFYGDGTSCVVDMTAFVPVSLLARGKFFCSPIGQYAPPTQKSQAVQDMLTSLSAIGVTSITLPLGDYADGWDDPIIMMEETDHAKSLSVDALTNSMETFTAQSPELTTFSSGAKWTKTDHFEQLPTTPAILLPTITGFKDGQYTG